MAREPPARSVSAVAGGLWLPYECGPQERVNGWAATTLSELDRLAVTGAPVTTVSALVLGEPEPWWLGALPPGRAAREGEGVRMRVPLVETPRYLDWLLGRVRALGGTLELRELGTLDELCGTDGVVVNCSGLGARSLVGDDALAPVRGEVLHVRPRPGARPRCLVDERELLYVLPRPDVCVLGGTAEASWDDEPRPEAFRAIWERCLALEPALEGAERVGAAVGLRPARPEVRCERDSLDDGTPVVHDYGHGGGGLTLSWGCADEVAALACAA